MLARPRSNEHKLRQERVELNMGKWSLEVSTVSTGNSFLGAVAYSILGWIDCRAWYGEKHFYGEKRSVVLSYSTISFSKTFTCTMSCI